MKLSISQVDKLVSVLNVIIEKIEERKFRISTGTWMGRRTVFNSGKQYDRKRTKQETRREEVES